VVEAFTHFFVSAAVIVVAGVFLTRYSDRIAELTKLGRLLVGSVFLAAATSLPEFFVDMSAVRTNMPNLAVGDLLGSSLFNLLILAIADLIHKDGNILFSRASSQHALAASMCISVTAVAGTGILLGPPLAKYSLGELGLGTASIVVAYLLGLRMIYFNQSLGTALRDSLTSGVREQRRRALVRALGGYLMASGAILLAAPFMAEAAGEIAEKTGIGTSFVGTTLVAFSTSLPEFVSTISAVRRGAFDLALGNIFGSNAFNMILLAPLDLFYEGSSWLRPRSRTYLPVLPRFLSLRLLSWDSCIRWKKENASWSPTLY